MNQKYLKPTDDFCAVKSWSQAKKEFEALGYFGEVYLGFVRMLLSKDFPKYYLGTKPPEKLQLIQWICADPKAGNITMTAFLHKEDYMFYDNIIILAKVDSGTIFVADEEIFCYQHEEVDIDGKKLEDWTIFSLAYIDNEKMAMLVSMVWGQKPISASLHKCFIINDGINNTEFNRCENYAVPIWKVKCESGQEKILAAFTDDYPLFDLYEFNTLNWQPLSPGKGFVRDKKYYIVADSPDIGYHFYSGLSISAKEPSP